MTVKSRLKEGVRIGRKVKKELKYGATGINEADMVLGRHVAAVAALATERAFRRALRVSGSVTIVADGRLIEVGRGGVVKHIREAEAPVRMKKGSVIRIK